MEHEAFTQSEGSASIHTLRALREVGERRGEERKNRREGQMLLSAFWKMEKWCFQVCGGVLKFLMDPGKDARRARLEGTQVGRVSFVCEIVKCETEKTVLE